MDNHMDEAATRKEKLQKIIDLGIDPYPAKSNKRTYIETALEKVGDKFWVAGRITSMRGHGKSTFADITDDSGKIQAYFKLDQIGEEKYAFLDLLDEGDIVEIFGEVFITKMGETTIKVEEFNLLSKSLLPAPSQWYGLKDVELRYRKRTLDFITNQNSREIIKTRSKTISVLRKQMEKEGFIEVETPILQPIPGGAAAKPFVTHYNILEHDFYLRIAPELYLKRLVSGGFEKVFEIGRTFRNEGLSHMHNPEFTMFEFYWAYKDYNDLMDFTQLLIPETIKEVTGSLKVKYQDTEIDFAPPYPRVTLRELILKDSDIDIDKFNDFESLKAEIEDKKINIDMTDITVWSKLVDELYKKVSRPKIIQPTFVTNQPIEIVPLAKADGKKAQMFQLVLGYGIELIKAYSELNNPIEQEERIREQMEMRKAGFEEGERLDKNYIESLSYGMPPTAGWGMGIDRFLMLLTNQYSIKEVIPFPTLRPEKE
jgi:lysyl-tRNA synthetase, class II